MKKEINAFDYAGEICKALPGGILLTTKVGEKVNTMTIGWGTIGIEWGKPIFTVFVREGRFTREMLDQNPEFTINVPVESTDKKILGYCGSKSGRDCDKIADLGLTLVEPGEISVPGIKELPITLECKVIYRQTQDLAAITPENQARYYPQDVGSDSPRANRDVHIAYYGQIVGAYLAE